MTQRNGRDLTDYLNQRGDNSELKCAARPGPGPSICKRLLSEPRIHH
jgi:hypothetical protein